MLLTELGHSETHLTSKLVVVSVNPLPGGCAPHANAAFGHAGGFSVCNKWSGLCAEIDGKKGKEEKPEPEANFALSGKLAAESNTVNGVVLVHQEPPESRQPSQMWRLYGFKNGLSLFAAVLTVFIGILALLLEALRLLSVE